MQNNDVVIVQLPFEFEKLFNQASTNGPSSPPTIIRIPRSELEQKEAPPNTENLTPRYRRRLKTRKSIVQHLEELDSPLLRLSENGREIYCTACEMDLTEYGKVKKSSIKLHLKCKRHLFNLKQMERKSSKMSIPPEIKRDEAMALYKCLLCRKAISNDIHDVRRHCAGKRHKKLLEEHDSEVRQLTMETEEVPVSEEPQSAQNVDEPMDVNSSGTQSARDFNNEFVDDVLDYIMKSNSPFSSIKHLKKLLGKWTNMSLPTIESIRKNHLPRYYKMNPEMEKQREEAMQRRLVQESLSFDPSRSSATIVEEAVETVLAENDLEKDNEEQEEETVICMIPGQESMPHIEINGNPVSTLELEQALHAFHAAQGHLFAIGDLMPAE